MDVKTAMERCIADLSRAEKTKATYKGGLVRFAEYLGTKGVKMDDDVSTLNIEHFIYFVPWLNRYAKQTAGVYISSADCLLRWLVTAKIIFLDYRDTIRYTGIIKDSRRRRQDRLPRWPGENDVSNLLKAVKLCEEKSPTKERNIAMLEFLASTGCRNNEMVQLKVKDLEMKTRSTIVNGKGSKERRVFFNEETAAAIYAYWEARKSCNPNEPVFARHDKKAGKKVLRHMSTDTPRNVVKEMMILAGIEKGKFSPHYFRHAFAMKALSATHDVALVQDLLGHKDPKSTRVYAKIRAEDLLKAYREIFK